MTVHDLTMRIASKEGLKLQVNIAQIKEITKIVLTMLAAMPDDERETLLGKYRAPDHS